MYWLLLMDSLVDDKKSSADDKCIICTFINVLFYSDRYKISIGGVVCKYNILFTYRYLISIMCLQKSLLRLFNNYKI